LTRLAGVLFGVLQTLAAGHKAIIHAAFGENELRPEMIVFDL